jgi:hypothetical protein
MSKHKNSKPPITPEVPAVVQRAIDVALASSFPKPSEQEQELLPNLLELLSPTFLADPRWKGQGEPKRVLREPLLMLSWDRMGGAWKVAYGDRVYELSGAVLVPSLVTCLVDAERLLSEGRFPFKQKKLDW